MLCNSILSKQILIVLTPNYNGNTNTKSAFI